MFEETMLKLRGNSAAELGSFSGRNRSRVNASALRCRTILYLMSSKVSKKRVRDSEESSSSSDHATKKARTESPSKIKEKTHKKEAEKDSLKAVKHAKPNKKDESSSDSLDREYADDDEMYYKNYFQLFVHQEPLFA